MTQASNGDTVRIHYSGQLNDGTPFDSSRDREPMEFILGGGQVIPGFEKAVEGMAVGESKSFSIPSEEAYGQHREELVQDVPSSALPEELTPVVGMQLQGSNGEGQTMNLVVTEVKEDAITVDGNHPLAGQDLNFEVELVEIA
ncbi:MAG: peptidylprolyl isomerase [Halieaceae bacterium]|jgi:peptidylprolyl isomerase|nr:peptidylprolyl isomerase [Halieaceae bacterium]